ncbi:MAG: IclR family transcriptional regulator C-terminal domain-containing protein [Pseudomonadota bacterium]
MSGFDRYDKVLRLFTAQKSTWTVAEISGELGTTSSTTYRTVRELVAAGLLESTVASSFRLGPAFLEYEQLMRVTDPLVRSGAVFLETLVEQLDVPCSSFLARLYGEKVMCVAEARTPNMTLQTSYRRGRPMPILRGATSKAILATLATRPRERLVHKLADIGPEGVAELFAELQSIRKSRLSVTFGEVDTGAIGIAAPIENKPLGINASLSVVLRAEDFSEPVKARVFSLLSTNAKLIENFMDDAQSELERRSGAA